MASTDRSLATEEICQFRNIVKDGVTPPPTHQEFSLRPAASLQANGNRSCVSIGRTQNVRRALNAP
jgi:hypothetical protein